MCTSVDYDFLLPVVPYVVSVHLGSVDSRHHLMYNILLKVEIPVKESKTSKVEYAEFTVTVILQGGDRRRLSEARVPYFNGEKID